MDMKDIQAKKPVLNKPEYIGRVRSLVRTQKAQIAAANCARGWKKVCPLVVQKKGHASGK